MKVLLSKLGMDGHDRGIALVAMALRDAGMEIVYLGRHNTVSQIIGAALQEDVDVIGLSSSVGAHRTLAPEVVKALKEKGVNDIRVVLGGFIPPEDIPSLKDNGIDEVFGYGSKLEDIVRYISKIGQKKMCG